MPRSSSKPGEPDVAAQQMRAFAKTGRRRREDPVLPGSHQVAHSLSAPAAMPSAVDHGRSRSFRSTPLRRPPHEHEARLNVEPNTAEDCGGAADMWQERVASPSLFFVLAPGPVSD